MGKMEQEIKKALPPPVFLKKLLTTALIGGLLLIGAVPPPNALFKMFGKSRNKHRLKNQVKSSLSKLAGKGYITFAESGGKRFARITETGKCALAFEEQKRSLELHSKKKWDKCWRVIIFDIPERRRSTRDRLRVIMRSCGFYMLQDSVWLYPYDCEDLVTLLKADLKIGNAILYIIAEKI